jgi:transcription initiation factor IIE alpha subunit
MLIDDLKKQWRYVCRNPECDTMLFTDSLFKMLRCPVCGDMLEAADNKL